MRVSRLFVMISLIFVSLALHASTVGVPAVQTPTFVCDPVGTTGSGEVRWGTTLTSVFSVALTEGEITIPPESDFTPFECSGNAFSEKPAKGKVKINPFVITKKIDKATPILFSTSDAGTPTLQPVSVSVNFGTMFESTNSLYDSLWDITMLYHQVGGDGSIVPNSDALFFLGYEQQSSVGFVDPGSVFFQDGVMYIDPAVPDEETTISLYATPQVPVPEPGSLMLLGTGLASVAAGLRRKMEGR